MQTDYAKITNTMTESYIATTPIETAAAEPKETFSFLGLYIRKDLKDKIAEEAKREERSMSKLASRIFEKHFNNECHS